MIKCSICSYQCDNWYVANWRLACHIHFSLGRRSLELARSPSRVALARHFAGRSTPFGVTNTSEDNLYIRGAASMLRPQICFPLAATHALLPFSSWTCLRDLCFFVLSCQAAGSLLHSSVDPAAGSPQFGGSSERARTNWLPCVPGDQLAIRTPATRNRTRDHLISAYRGLCLYS